MSIDFFGIKVGTQKQHDSGREEYKTIKVYRITFIELAEKLGLYGDIKNIELDNNARIMEIKTEKFSEKDKD